MVEFFIVKTILLKQYFIQKYRILFIEQLNWEVAKQAFKPLRALLSNSHSLSPKSETKTFMENSVFLITNRNKNYFQNYSLPLSN